MTRPSDQEDLHNREGYVYDLWCNTCILMATDYRRYPQPSPRETIYIGFRMYNVVLSLYNKWSNHSYYVGDIKKQQTLSFVIYTISSLAKDTRLYFFCEIALRRICIPWGKYCLKSWRFMSRALTVNDIVQHITCKFSTVNKIQHNLYSCSVLTYSNVSC